MLFLGTLMAALDIAVVGPALPALREHFGVDSRTIAWVFTTFVLFNLTGLPLMVTLSDRIGRRTAYLTCIGLFGLGALIVGLAPSFPVLLVGRALQGLGTSGIFPVSSAALGDAFPPERRGRAVGVLGAVFGVAFIVGPILGGILLAVASWHWLFLLNVPVAACVALLSRRALPNTRRASPPPLDGVGLALLAATLVALALGLSRFDAQAPLASLLTPASGGLVALALGLVVIFWQVERRAANPLIRPGLLGSRQVRITCGLAAGAGLAEALFVFLSAYTIAAFGVTKAQGSYLLLPLMVTVTIGSPLAGRLLDRVGSRLVVLVGTALVAVGHAVLALGLPLPGHITGIILVGAGLSALLGSSLSYILLNEAEAHERAVAQGLITLFISIGQLAGGAFLGAVITTGGTGTLGYRLAFGVVAGVAALLALTALGLKTRRDEQATARA